MCLVGWGGRKINGGTRMFSFGPTKKFSLQNGEKTKGRKWDCLMDKMPISNSIFFLGARHVLTPLFFPFLLFIYLFSFLDVPFFFIIYFLSCGCDSCFVLFFCFLFFFLTKHDFYFLINWVIAFFFGCLSLFCFNWPSFF